MAKRFGKEKQNNNKNKVSQKPNTKKQAKKETTKTEKKIIDKKSNNNSNKRINKKIILNVIEVIFIIVIIVSGVNIIKWVNENKRTKETLADISTAITVNNDENTGEERFSINFEELKQKNSDVVAWIKIYGTNIEYPIVKASNNDKYLNTSFDGTYNSAGWPFADYRNKFDGTDKNIIMYGHNRKDNSMFGTQKNTQTEEWQNEYKDKSIIFITENENAKYKVFSVYNIEDEAYFVTTDFGENQFSKFVNTLKKRSEYDFGVEVGEDDSIITLSTCYTENHRTVLHAVKIKEETQEGEKEENKE